MIKNKRGWLRIVEAFMAIIIILGVVLVLNQRAQTSSANIAEEIPRLEKNILDFVSQDSSLRSQVLSGNLSGVDNIVKVMIPAGYSYAIRNCTVNATYNPICSLDFYIPQEVYADDTLIAANLTYFQPQEAKKLKIFIWRGGFPEGVTAPEY